MEGKYIIQETNNNWYIDYDGELIIEVKNFVDALKFESKEHAKDFCKLHELGFRDYQLLKLKLTTELMCW